MRIYYLLANSVHSFQLFVCFVLFPVDNRIELVFTNNRNTYSSFSSEIHIIQI